MGTATQGAQYGIASESQRGISSGADMRTLLFGYGDPAQNFIINGAADFFQRAQLTSVGGSYFTDRWFLRQDISGGEVIATRNSGTFGVGNNSHRLVMTTYTSGSVLSACQSIETAMVRQLAGKKITISFLAVANSTLFSSPTAKVTLRVLWGTGTDEKHPTGGVAIDYSINTNTISSTYASPTTVSASFDIPPNATSMRVSIGYENSVGPWPSGSVLDFSNVMLNLGPVALPFSRAGKTIGGELALCHRYYRAGFNGSIFSSMGVTDRGYVFCQHPGMRITPSVDTVFFSNATKTSALFIDGDNAYTPTGIAAQDVQVNASVVALTGVTIVANKTGRLSQNCIGLDAEL